MNPEAALKRVVQGCRKAFIAVGCFSLAINLLMLIVPIYMMQMYDRVIASGNVDTLVLLTIIAAAGLLSMSLVEMMRSRIMVRLGSWVDRSLSGPVLSGSMNDSLRAGGLTGASGLRELNTLRGFLTGAGVFPLLDAPWVPIFVAIIFMIHPTLGLLAVAGAIIVFLFALANDISTRKPLKQANGAAAKALYRADAMVRNADVAAAMGMEPHLVRRWRDSNEEGLGLQALASDRAGSISAMAKFVRLVLQIAMLGVGAYFVTQGELTGGGMIAGSIILSRAMAPIEQSINAWRGAIAAKGAYDNIKALLGRTPASGDAMDLPRPSGQVSVEGIGFVPPGASEPVLRGVSLEIEAGECIGLIGASASGKTTLARILVGSWRPTAGHARMDGADVFIWEAADRGRYIGYLPQDVELFDGPVRENIARMGEPDGDAVIAAARMAGVHELILRLPNGYETMIGDGGTRLSGGQRQRIALARALYGEPALVVLDEPNSNLDTEGERALMDALNGLKETGVTTVVIAHRPTILASVDRLVVMHQGRIEMEGPRDEVLAKVAPGSLDAVRRAALAEQQALADRAADAGGEAGAAQPEPGVDGASPPHTDSGNGQAEAPRQTEKPPGFSGEMPVVRIHPGAGRPASATAPGEADDADGKPDPVVVAEAAPPAAARDATPGAATSTSDAATSDAATSDDGRSADAKLGSLFDRLMAKGAADRPPAKPDRPRPTAAPIIDAKAEPPAQPAPASAPSDRHDDLGALFKRITADAPPPAASLRKTETTAEPPPRRMRAKRALNPSPTAPGRLFPTAATALTGDARPSGGSAGEKSEDA